MSNRLIAEIHWYTPFDFTINGSDTTHWQWGALATDPSAVESWGNEAYSRQEFDKAMAAFVNKGVPLIMGEFGAYPKNSGLGQNVETYTNYWAQYNTYAAVTRGVVPMWGDTGAMIDRNTGAVKDSGLLNAIITGISTNPEPAASVGVNGS